MKNLILVLFVMSSALLQVACSSDDSSTTSQDALNTCNLATKGGCPLNQVAAAETPSTTGQALKATGQNPATVPLGTPVIQSVDAAAVKAQNLRVQSAMASLYPPDQAGVTRTPSSEDLQKALATYKAASVEPTVAAPIMQPQPVNESANGSSAAY